MERVRRGDVEIAYEVRGAGNETLVLVNGLGGSSLRWGSVVPRLLGRRLRVVLVDNRGTGESTKSRRFWAMEDMTEDLVAVLDDAGIDRPHVMGVSMGGMISQLLAVHHPERVDHLVLLSTHFGGPAVVDPSEETVSAMIPPRGTSNEDAVRSAMRAICAPGYADAHPEVIEELVGTALAKPTPFSTMMAHRQAILESDRSEIVRRIRAPTLVIHGDLDPLVPFENGRMLAERIQGSALHVLDGVGHMPMWEAPERLARAVEDFIVARRRGE